MFEVLSTDWGLSWDEAGELGNRMWGRNYHFTFAWVFLGNGLAYVAWGLWKGRLLERLWPRRGEASPRAITSDLRRHLRWPRRHHDATESYGPLQKISYLLLIFVYVPLMLLTGLAQSPGFTAAWPWLLDMFGGRQTARSLHAFGTVAVVVFVVVHVLEVFAAGALGRLHRLCLGGGQRRAVR